MSDQTPEVPVPGLPDPEQAADAGAEALGDAAPETLAETVESAPEALAGPTSAAVPPPPPPPVTDVPPPPPAFGAPAPPPPGYAPLVATVPVFPNGKPMLDATGQPVSDKSRLAAALLCWFVGVLGIHRFYVGKNGTGIAMLLTCGGLGFWALFDLFMILVGSFRDIDGKALQNW
jgi:hypothetical protein